MSMIENYQQEESIKEPTISQYTLARVGDVYKDGLSLIFPGSTSPSQKHYKCNADINFSVGDTVYVIKDSGTYIVICKIGVPSGWLPSGYIELEYIESTGNQYIDTGFIPNSNTKIEIQAEIKSSKSNGAFFGSRSTNSGTDSYSNSLLILSGGSVRSDFYGNSQNLGNIPEGRNLIVREKNNTTISDIGITQPAKEKSSTCSLYLFSVNTSDSPSLFGNIAIYSCKIYSNDTISRNYIPCKNLDNQIGLYDLISKKFYENKGTENFIAGPEKE